MRYTDPERYLALSRVVTGEVMAATFAEWRRERSTCSGAMVWFYRDLWPGAGWGVVDSTGRPKAAFHYLKRAFANVVVFLSDEGLNGLHAHVVNESAQALHAKLDITFHKDGERAVIANATQVIELTPHSQCELTVSALLPWFLDTTYAYRFGPPSHDLCVATLTDARDAKVLGDAFHMPLGLSTARSTDLGLSATAAIDGDGSYLLTLASQRFAYAVAIDCPGYVAENDFVNVPPSAARTLRLRPTAGARALSGYVSALNATQPVKIIVAPNDSASRAGQ